MKEVHSFDHVVYSDCFKLKTLREIYLSQFGSISGITLHAKHWIIYA